MPANALPGVGLYRRRIDLRKVDHDCAIGWVEDDFHHFGVALTHSMDHVCKVEARAERYPWSTCPGAADSLQALVGKPLVARASDVGRLIEMRLQCTHQFDLAGLVSAFIVSGLQHRVYEVLVSDREVYSPPDEYLAPVFGCGTAQLWRDGVNVVEWNLDNDRIIAPEVPAGMTLGKGFREWTETLALEPAEFAFILRRAIQVAGGRTVDHDRFDSAADMQLPALCHSYQPAQRNFALRCVGGTRNYSENADGMLAHVPELKASGQWRE